MPIKKATKAKRTTKTTLALNSPNRTLPDEVPEMQGQPPPDGQGDNDEPQDGGRSINQGTQEENTEITEQKDTSIPEVPTVQANFITSLVKFGVKPASAKAITDYIVATGSPLVFEDPLELLAKMTKFPFQVPALIRRQVLDYWIAINKIELPDDYQKQVNKMDKTDKNDGNNDGEAKVQIIGGMIVPTDEKMSITDAQKVQAAVAAVSGDGRGGGKGSDEAKFTMDDNGELTILPGAKLSVVDAMLYGTIKQRRAAGDTRDPLEILADSFGKVESVKAALGMQSGGNSNPLSTPDGLKSLKEIFGTEEATRAMLAKMDENNAKSQENIVNLIKAMNDKPKEDPQVAEMKTQLAALNTKLDAEREERHKLEADALKKQISDLSNEIRTIGAGKQATDAYGIMGKGIDKISEGLNKATDKIGELMTRGGNPNLIPSQPPQQKSAWTAALSGEARKATASSKLGAQLFEKPAQAPPPPPAGLPTIPFTEQG